MLPDRLQLRNSSAFIYPDQSYSQGRGYSVPSTQSNINEIRQQAYQGRLTKGSKKRLERACTILSEMSLKRRIYNEVSKRAVYFKLSMITLTISTTKELLTPKEGNKTLLKPFLRWMTRTKGATGYVWKCEHQSNGQIHYHILTNQFINYQEIRTKWNQIQKKHGYLTDYYKKYHNYDPNSTDVHAIRKVKNITAYFISYLKAEKNDKEITQGKIWDCSYNIKKARYYSCEPDRITAKNLQDGIKNDEIETFTMDYVTCLHFKKKPAKFYLSANQYREYLNYYAAIANQPTEPPEPDRPPTDEIKKLLKSCLHYTEPV